MEIIGIKTRIINPPQDDLYGAMDESVQDVQEGDVFLVSSKVMAIHQGRCVLATDVDKDELVIQEAERIFSYYNSAFGKRFRLTLKKNTLIGAGGVDESNGDGYYILWPTKIMELCREIREYLCKRFGVKDIAVIAVDSHSLPLRYGAMGISIGFYGMKPLKPYEGTKDLFGKKFTVERSNLVDMLASAGTLVMGEGTEQMPLAIIRGAKQIEFVDEDTSKELFIPLEEDMYWPMLQILEKNTEKK